MFMIALPERLVVYSERELPLVLKRLARLFRIRKNSDGEFVRLPIAEKTLSHVHTLLRKSNERPLGLEGHVPWDLGINRNCPAKDLSQLWLYGTPFHQLLSEAQRIELSWLEVARDVSSLIKLKEYTSSLYMGYLNKYKRSLPPAVQDYLLVHAKEEIVHALALKRFMKLAELPTFSSFPAFGHISALFPEMHPCFGIMGNLLLGWIIDAGAMYYTQSTGVDALTREVIKLHHVDNVRHLDFSRRLVDDYFTDSTRQQRQRVRQIFKRVIPDMLDSYRFDPEIARHTSFDFPVSPDKQEFVNAIRHSAHNEWLDKVRFADLRKWLLTLDLI